ncbi:bile acid:sodium symporter [bacterium]|nr:bile acid:sodium symporter [bacterium]
MLELIKKWTGLFLLGAVAIGFIFPIFAVLKPLMIPLLMLLLYCSFVRMKFQVKRFVRKELLIFPIICWIIFPPLVYYSTTCLGPALQIGFLLVVITPPALGSPVMVSLAKGDLEYTVANVTLFNILSPLVFALLPGFFIKDSTLAINYYDIFWRVTVIIFIPLLLAYFTEKSLGLKNFVLSKIDPLKGLVQMFLIVIAVANSAQQIRAMNNLHLARVVIITFILAGLFYLIGWLIAFNKKMKYTLPITTGHKNTLLTITIAIASFSEITALPAVFYLIAHHTYNGIIINLSRKVNTLNEEV